MSLRELRDTLTNVILQWSKHVFGPNGKGESEEDVRLFLDACFHRIGELCWASWKVGDVQSPVADDVANIERIEVTVNKQQMNYEQVTLTCIRNLISTLLVAYRLLHWQITASHDHEYTELATNQFAEVQKHHVQASLDVFYKLAMYYDLPPASRLNYMHNFSGLYNCISQVITLCVLIL